MDTILPSLLDKAASPGLSGSAAAGGSGVAGASAAGAADVSTSTRGDTVTFSAEGLAKAAAMASNAGTTGHAETASNAGAGLDAKGQTMGGTGNSKAQKSEDEKDATLQALKARVEQIQAEIKAEEQDDAPREEREAKLAELRLSLIEAQTAYYKAKQQAGNDQGGSASQMAAAMAGTA